MSGAHLRFNIPIERFLKDLTEATCQAVLKRGFRGPIAPLKTAVSSAIKKILKNEMQVSQQCGRSIIGICSHAERFEPWSKEARELAKLEKEEP
ncbi:MAG TPA: hypothetical protein VLJ37_05455 [bacterium]|nr:hypothetical protein [bacterium]